MVKWRKAKEAYYPIEIDERKITHDISVTLELSVTNIDYLDQPFAKVRKKIRTKSEASVSDFYTENMPVTNMKQSLQ